MPVRMQDGARMRSLAGAGLAGLSKYWSQFDSAARVRLWRKGIRTPDIQLAKLALYQLSYAPVNPLAHASCLWWCSGRSRSLNLVGRSLFQWTTDLNGRFAYAHSGLHLARMRHMARIVASEDSSCEPSQLQKVCAMPLSSFLRTIEIRISGVQDRASLALRSITRLPGRL